MELMVARFVIPPGRERDARQALAEYLAFLRAIGAVCSPSPRRYCRAVADTHALAAAIVVAQPGVKIDRELRWASEDEWPSGGRPMSIYESLGLPMAKGNPWLQLARLTPSVRANAPSWVCDALTKAFGIERSRLLGFLAKAGFLRVVVAAVEDRA